MLSWLLFAVSTGIPSGLLPGDVDRLARNATSELLAPVLGSRLAQLPAHPELADDTLAVLAPLAERVGLGEWRARLEESSFRAADPAGWAALADTLPSVEQDQQDLLAIRRHLEASFPEAEVHARLKSRWSLKTKAERKGVSPTEIFDRLALRLVLPDEEACYAALATLTARHPVVPGELDDYIRHPKPSGYQALHTALHLPTTDGRTVVAEVQLKTPAMHAEAEHGAAAHWRYKAPAA